MRKSTKIQEGRTVGIDLGDRFSQVCELDTQTGAVLGEYRISTTALAFESRFLGRSGLRIALETGTHSPWVDRLLRRLGHEVLVANARKLRAISQNPSKTDRADARCLAELARVSPSLLSPIRPRSEESQRDLGLLRARHELVRRRTDLINHVRGAVKSWGARLPSSSPTAFASRAITSLPTELRPALEPIVEMVAQMTEVIRRYDQAVEALAKQLPVCGQLRAVHGVGSLTAVAFVRMIDDPRRFARSREVGAYLGLAPVSHRSGNSDPQRRISKRGSTLMRQLLVQASHHILGPFGRDSDLRRYGLAIAERGGKRGKKRAAVAVARKLAILLHRLWVTAAPYEALRAAS